MLMMPQADESCDTFGLLATGSAGSWVVDLDESHDGTKWALQLDGPQLYLAVAVESPAVIQSAVDYLQSGQKQTEHLPLGHFGSTSVALHWDHEFADRCFLLVGPTNRSVLRFTLAVEDIAALTQAFTQILEDASFEPVKEA